MNHWLSRLAFVPLFSWLLEQRRETLSLFALGLASGQTMTRAVAMAAAGTTFRPLRSAFAFLRDGLAQGRPLQECLLHPACGELPPLFRAILGSDLTDREKGAVLLGRERSSHSDTSTLKSEGMTYLVVEFAIAGLVLIQLMMFVLPQFKDIFLGLRIPLPAITEFLLMLGDLFHSPAVLLLLLLAPVALSQLWTPLRHLLSGARRQQELAEVFRILPGVAPERLPYVLTVIGHPLVLPHTAEAFRLLGESLLRKEPPDAALALLRADPLAACLLRLGLQPGCSPCLMTDGAELLETRVSASRKRWTVVLESLVTVGLGTGIGAICVGVMLPMILLLESL